MGEALITRRGGFDLSNCKFVNLNPASYISNPLTFTIPETVPTSQIKMFVLFGMRNDSGSYYAGNCCDIYSNDGKKLNHAGNFSCFGEEITISGSNVSVSVSGGNLYGLTIIY